jgi:uncharacterized peroxidase-related enzyme
MSRIRPRKRSDAPELEPQFQAVESRMGFLPNSQLVMAHKPNLLKAFGELRKAVYDPGGKVPIGLRYLVGHVASRAAGCQYCMAHTASNAKRASIEDRKLAAVWQYETSPLFSVAERAALRFAQAAGSVPNAVTDSDVAELRKHFDEAAMVEILAIVCYFGFLNRWNDSLATVLEDEPRELAEALLAPSGWKIGKHAHVDRV